MADSNAEELGRRVDRLFGLKLNLDGLNQELAYNFYPERADFTVERWLGTEFAIDLFDSAPVLCRRDLANARAAMLRPRGSDWFQPQTPDEKVNAQQKPKDFLQWMGKRMRAAMYQATSGFVRAQKEADHDLVTFGNAVQTVEGERTRDGRMHLRNRTWHLRDCVWLDDADGIGQDFFGRRFKASARHIKAKFPEAPLAEPIVQALDKEPDKEFQLCHVMMLADEYDWRKKPRKKAQFASIYYDRDNKTILRERPSNRFRYVTQRWATVTNFQYGLSPAAIASLSDARGIQTMARVLLEAGEKTLDPPLKATQKAVKSAINVSAGGITWVDKEYDEKLGAAIEPLFPLDTKPPVGIDLILRTTAALKDAWYLTKLSLPQTQEMTAFEAAQRVEEFIRANIPLFEPWESDTELVLSETLNVLLDIGWFGPMDRWPQELSNSDIDWAFSNPLGDAIERNKVNWAQAALGILAGATKIDPASAHAVDVVKMTSDAVKGTGAPADWTPDLDKVMQNAAQAAQPGNVLGALQTAGQAAGVVNQGLDAAAKLRDLTAAQPADQEGAFGPT